MKSTILFAAALFLTSTRAFSFENNDKQFWIAIAAYKSLSRQTTARIGSELKFSDMSNHYITRFDVGMTHQLNGWLVGGVAFKKVNVAGKNSWNDWDIPFGDVVFKWKNRGVQFDLRNRVEYWSRPEVENFWRVRQRFRLTSVNKFTVANARPYVAAEYFYNASSFGLKMTRLYVGSKMPLTRVLGLDFFYCFQTITIDDEWLNFHVIGMIFNIRL